MSRPGSWAAVVMAFIELGKPRVSLLAALAAGAGCALAGGGAGTSAAASAGVLLISCGAGALNELQERDLDARVERTKGRPLPSGRLTSGQAVGFVLIAGFSGLAVLGTGRPAAAVLGAAAAVLYNGVYTPLKRLSSFAALPGALAGAIPPAIGWVYGGSSLADIRVHALCLVMFIWQVPHSWLVLFGREEGFGEPDPGALSGRMSGSQLRRLVPPWVLGTAVSTLLFAAGGAVHAPATRGALLAASLWLAWQALSFRLKPASGALSLFRRMNLFMLGALLLAALDPLFR